MSRKLTSREKVLIYILGFVTIFSLVVVFVLMPGMVKLNKITDKLHTAEVKQEEAKKALYGVDILEQEVEGLKLGISSAASDYYAPMAPEESDVILSGIVTRYGFTPESLKIEPIISTDLISFKESQKMLAENGSVTKEESTQKYVFSGYRMTIAGSNTSNNFPALCGEISLNPSMHLVSYSIENVIEEVENTTTTNNTTNRNTSTNNTTNNRDTTNNRTSTTTSSSYNATLVVDVYCYRSSYNSIDTNNEKEAAPEITPDANQQPVSNNKTDANGTETQEQDNTNTTAGTADGVEEDFILNTKSGYFHRSSCTKVTNMLEENKKLLIGTTVQEMESSSYKPCGECIR